MSPVITLSWTVDLFRAVSHFLPGLVGIVAMLPLSAHQPDAIYISPAGHNYRADGMPLQSAETVRDSLRLSAKMGVNRVYWRGFQEQYLNRHADVRSANFALSDYWRWLLELDQTRGIHRAALEAGNDEGMEIWGVFGLFDHGSDPREDAYCGAAAGYGPSVFADTLRSKFPDAIPRDRAGIRMQCGPLRFTDPELRRILIARLSELMDEGYDGLLLYSYVENLSLWFPGEFDRDNHGPLTADEVTLFVTELRAELAKNGKRLALQVDPRESFRHVPSPWLGLTPNINTVGNVPLPWEKWLRDGLLDEVVFSVPSDAEAEAVAFAEEVAQNFPGTPIRLLARQAWPKSSLPIIADGRSPEWSAQFRQQATSVDSLSPWAIRSKTLDPTDLAEADSAAVTATLAALKMPPSPTAARDVAALVQARSDYSIRQQAGEILGTWGEDANAALSTLATDPDPAVRRVAYHAASQLASFDQARPILEDAIRDPHPHNRWIGFRGLARAPMDASFQQVIAQTLQGDPDPTVRSVAAWLVRPGTEIEPALFEALSAHFVALHNGDSWRWEYRTVGDALFGSGADGQAFLENCLLQTDSPRLADSAWRCLFIRQNGSSLKLVDLPTALQAYQAFPKKNQEHLHQTESPADFQKNAQPSKKNSH